MGVVAVAKRVLVVEDDNPIRELVVFHAEKEGYSVQAVSDGRQAVGLLNKEQFDLVILDLMLPELDGIEVCKHIRNRYGYAVYVLMLTAKGEEVDRIIGLEMGADDYMVKPFSPRELMVRVKAAFRRSATQQMAATLSGGGVTLDRERHEAVYNGKQLDLTPKQFALLAHMMRNKGKVCSREELLEAVWGFDFYGDTRTVDVHISQLRNQLQQAAGEEQIPIETLRGVGYRFRGDR